MQTMITGSAELGVFDNTEETENNFTNTTVYLEESDCDQLITINFDQAKKSFILCLNEEQAIALTNALIKSIRSGRETMDEWNK